MRTDAALYADSLLWRGEDSQVLGNREVCGANSGARAVCCQVEGLAINERKHAAGPKDVAHCSHSA